MIRSFSLAGFLLLLVLNLSAHAACGGGGNAPSSPPVTRQSSEVRQSSDNSNAALDTNRFDRISPRLNLSREQMKEINKIESDINRKAGDGSVRGNDARHEFDRRLADVLNADQLRTYYTLR